MKKTRMRMAALALGGALTLLLPATAAARDRDDRGGERDRGRVEQNWNRGGDRFRGGERYEHRDSDRHEWRDRDDRGSRFYFNYNPAPQGYYDAYGYWHPYYGY